MAATYIPIASTTLATTAASVTFSDIPATYTDLVLKVSARSDRSNFIVSTIDFRFNGLSTNIHSWTTLQGDGSAASSARATAQNYGQGGWTATNNATASTFGNGEFYFPNYTSTSKKVVSDFGTGENNATASYIAAIAHLVDLTTPITSMLIFSNAGYNFVSGSTFHLYGISNT
jgi:hypothetical protein